MNPDYDIIREEVSDIRGAFSKDLERLTQVIMGKKNAKKGMFRRRSTSSKNIIRKSWKTKQWHTERSKLAKTLPRC